MIYKPSLATEWPLVALRYRRKMCIVSVIFGWLNHGKASTKLVFDLHHSHVPTGAIDYRLLWNPLQ